MSRVIDVSEDQGFREDNNKQFYTVIEEINEEDGDTHDDDYSNNNLSMLIKNEMSSIASIFYPYQSNKINSTKDTLYGCTIGGCQSKFENENELSNHYQTVHRLDLVYLSKQSNLFPTQSGDKNENSLPSNEISKTKIRKYPCGYPGCQWVFTRTNHVVRHHERVHPGFRPQKTSSEQSLIDVKKKGVTAYMCHKTDCKQIFSNPILLKNHIKLSHETNSNIDDISSAIKFKTSNGLKLREALTGYVCDLADCGQKFNSKLDLSFHLFQDHSLVEPEVSLRVEGEEWTEDDLNALSSDNSTDLDGKASLLRSKEDGHTLRSLPSSTKCVQSSRPYACTLPGCDKTYTKNSHLVRHLVETHKLAKPITKSSRRVCSASLPIQQNPITSSTEVNSTTTVNDRPYVCNHPGCGWSFKRQYHLNRHIITHKMVKSLEKNDKEVLNELDLEKELLMLNKCIDLSLKDVKLMGTKLEPSALMDSEPLICDYPGCGEMFLNSTFLMEHYLIHSGPSSDFLERNSLSSQLLECVPVECVLQELTEEEVNKSKLEDTGDNC